MALIIVYEISYMFPFRWKKAIPLFDGLLIGLIGLAIMMIPFQLSTGLFFDTRTILLGVSALTFGTIPSAVAAGILIIYRMIIGGIGVWMGVATILTSTAIGILWRHFLLNKIVISRWLNIYLFGIVVHIVMLSCAFIIPWPTSFEIFKQISLPVIFIYPIGTVLLSLLILHQKERKESIIKLTEAEERYRSIFDNNHAVMLLIDPENGQIIDANAAATKFYGWTIDTMKSMNISQINTLNFNEIKEEMEKSAFENKSHFIFQHRKASDSIVDVEVHSGPIKLNKKVLIYSIVHDISESKKLESEKNEMEAQLRQQQKLEAIGTLAGGVAHEINNPINGIMNYAQLILNHAGTNNTIKQVEYANEIIHESERVSLIVKNLLQFSRQEKQSHSYASIYDIIDQTISLISTVIKKDQITLEVHLDENLPDIKCRSQQIQQVLMNLLTNARDALNEKYEDYNEDKMIRVQCSQFSFEERRWIKITVEDHGNGIPSNLQEKIFEPFFSTKPKEKGTGLGLSISFGIIKDHHGTVIIDSKIGCYTKFILNLPVDNGWSLKE